MKKLLVICNDKIGDFMLVWLSFVMLKVFLLDCYIIVLVLKYIVVLVEFCLWIDVVIIDFG